MQFDLARTIRDVQQDFALNCSMNAKIIWDALAADQGDILKEKIANLLPDIEESSSAALQKQREKMFTNIWQQRKYSNGNLLSTIIYVMVVKCKLSCPEVACKATKYSCHPVVRIRKCINDNDNQRTSSGCCMIFVDEEARIYENWKDYLNNNTLPDGIMVAPTNGVYTFDANNNVSLICKETPNRKKSYLNIIDVTAVAGSLALAAPLLIPVMTPVAIGLSIASLPFGIYTTVRSAMNLHDRRVHGQSIALTDSTARGIWLGTVGGAVSVGAIGASGALTMAASRGRNICMAAKIAVNGMNVSSIVFSGAGMINGVYDIFLKVNDDEKIDAMDIMQLATTFVTITHAINNFRIISQIPTDNRSSASIRRSLTKFLQNFNARITNQSMPIQDVIRTVNNIPNIGILFNLHTIYSVLQTTLDMPYLTDISDYFSNPGDMEKLNFSTLTQHFGINFVQHIMNEYSFSDMMKTIAKYCSENIFQWLMKFTSNFITINAKSIDVFLNSFISTETILYKIFMYIIENCTSFTIDDLKDKANELQQHVELYFASFNPVNKNNSKYNCKVCKGYYYINVL